MNQDQAFYHSSLNSSGARKVAKIASEDATVQRANAEVDSAHALLLDVNVTQMFVGIAGLGKVFYLLYLIIIVFYAKNCTFIAVPFLYECFFKHYGVVLSSSPYLHITFWN